MTQPPISVYLIDDEPLAIDRMRRLLAAFDHIRIIGSATDPETALRQLAETNVDALFLDIRMPGLDGFELLAKLSSKPIVIFTTAYDEYALRAFEVNSIDYLLKPVEENALERAIAKLTRLCPSTSPQPQNLAALEELVRNISNSRLQPQSPAARPHRIARRVGGRITFLDLDTITYFIAHDKLTHAVVEGRRHSIDATIQELEDRLASMNFLRIHRSVLVNLDFIREVSGGFVGKVQVTLNDAQQTQLTVARDRVSTLKSRLDID